MTYEQERIARWQRGERILDTVKDAYPDWSGRVIGGPGETIYVQCGPRGSYGFRPDVVFHLGQYEDGGVAMLTPEVAERLGQADLDTLLAIGVGVG